MDPFNRQLCWSQQSPYGVLLFLLYHQWNSVKRLRILGDSGTSLKCSESCHSSQTPHHPGVTGCPSYILFILKLTCQEKPGFKVGENMHWDHQDAHTLWAEANELQPQWRRRSPGAPGRASHGSFPWIMPLQPKAAALVEQNVCLK